MKSVDLAGAIKRYPVRVGCVVLSLLLGVGIYWLNDSIAESTANLEQRTTQGSRLAENVKNSAQLAEQLEALTTAGKQIESRLIRANELANNLQYFYRLEAEAGVELLDLRQAASSGPAKGAAKTNFNGVGFTVALRGNYVAILNCLRRLENGPHICRILSASIEGSSPDRAGPVKLMLTLELLGQP